MVTVSGIVLCSFNVIFESDSAIVDFGLKVQNFRGFHPVFYFLKTANGPQTVAHLCTDTAACGQRCEGVICEDSVFHIPSFALSDIVLRRLQ